MKPMGTRYTDELAAWADQKAEKKRLLRDADIEEAEYEELNEE